MRNKFNNSLNIVGNSVESMSRVNKELKFGIKFQSSNDEERKILRRYLGPLCVHSSKQESKNIKEQRILSIHPLHGIDKFY